MEKNPVLVQFIGEKEGKYQIKFPNLEIPVTVNEKLYTKMLHSTEYQFINSTSSISQATLA